MGCKKLNTNFFSFLEVVHSEKRACEEKNRVKVLEYVYQYKDHLGNVRLSYTDNNNDGIIQTDGMNTEIIEESNYYPFGLKMRGLNTFRNVGIGNPTAQKKGYANKELEEDLGLNTISYGWRDYDPALARFNKIDRFAEKYEDLTPYHFTANNPLTFVEINGDSLDIASNKQSRKDINSLVRGKNRRYLKFNKNGSLSLDFSKLGKGKTIASVLKSDGGLNLLNDMISSSKNFLYEASDVVLAKDGKGKKAGIPIFRDGNGVVNISNNGADGSGGHTWLPKTGYDGQLVIGTSVKFYEASSSGETSKSRSSIIFHEMSENYSRTHSGINYSGKSGAHNAAITRENSWRGKSNTPGAITRIVNPKPSATVRKKNFNIIKNYK